MKVTYIQKTIMKNKRIATTIKVELALYDEFKVLGVRHKLTLQGLVEKVIYQYVKDETFRDSVNNYILPIESGINVVTLTAPATPLVPILSSTASSNSSPETLFNIVAGNTSVDPA